MLQRAKPAEPRDPSQPPTDPACAYFASTCRGVLRHLATRPGPGEWQDWAIQPIGGGMNNAVYRITCGSEDYAVKLYRRDSRDRAGREYAALALLDAHGLDLAPRPLLLDRDSYPLPIVVQTWLAGDVHDAPPADDREWAALIGYFAQLHQLAPASLRVDVAPAVTNIGSVAQGRALIAEQLALLPAENHPRELDAIAAFVQQHAIAEPGGVRTALCRVDANTRNFVRRAGIWASVDWENSGWGEPAFEIVDLMTHPTYRAIDAARWGWVVEQYAMLSGDRYAADKIYTYYPLMLVWWAARTARLCYELPRGLDSRLSGSDELIAGLETQYQYYLRRAEDAYRAG